MLRRAFHGTPHQNEKEKSIKRTVKIAVVVLGAQIPVWFLLWTAGQARAQSGKNANGAAVPAADWPQFRGPNAGGVSQDRHLPLEFGPTKNVIWKTPVPPGNSSPCVWGDSIFLTAFAESKQLLVLCARASDGRIRWRKEVPAQRIEKVHSRDGSPASPTAATDGQRVYVFFGSVGLVCFDFHGKLAWRHELGPFTYNQGWGAASSPILYGDSVILNCDHDGESFLLALGHVARGV